MNRKVLKSYKFGFLLGCLLISPSYILGQDLGSSSTIFRKKNTATKTKPKTTKAKKTTTAKSTPTKKKVTPKKNSSNTTARNNRSTRRNSNTTILNDEPQIIPTTSAVNTRTPQDNIIINVGDTTSGDFKELFEQSIAEGNKYRNFRDYVKAEDAYSRAKSLNPKDSRAIYGLGNIYSDQQRWEEAETAYRQAIEIEPDNPAAHIAISYVLTQPVVGSNLGERYSEAEKMARNAINLDAENAIGYDQLGVALELRGLIGKETEDAYRKAIELNPDFALAYAHLGRLFRRHGLTKESSAAYRKAIQHSNDVPTMILVADVMQSQQRYLDSEQLLRNALRQDERNPTGLYLLGRALTLRKEFEEAESVLKKSVEISPNSFVSYALLGSVYYQSGKLDKAEQTLNRALTVISVREKKRLAQEFEEVGDRYMKANKTEDALRMYRRAKELDNSKKSLVLKLKQS